MANKQVKFIEEFPLDPKAILSSFDVFGMSSIHFGVYCKLLFVSWLQKPRQCFLELDEDNICGLCNITKKDWDSVKIKVLKKFTIQTEGDKTYIYNEVLLEKWQKLAVKEKHAKGTQLTAISVMLHYPFNQFWDDYDKKVGDKNRIIPKYVKLTDEEREKIRQDIPKRKAAQPDKKWRMKPERYINERGWEDEIINYTSKNSKTVHAADYGKQSNTPV